MIFVYIIFNNHILVKGGVNMHNKLTLINKNYSSKLNTRKGRRRKIQIDPILFKKKYQCTMIVDFRKLNSKEIYKSIVGKSIRNNEKYFYVNMFKKSSYLEFLEEFIFFKDPKSRIEDIGQFQLEYSFPKNQI